MNLFERTFSTISRASPTPDTLGNPVVLLPCMCVEPKLPKCVVCLYDMHPLALCLTNEEQGNRLENNKKHI